MAHGWRDVYRRRVLLQRWCESLVLPVASSTMVPLSLALYCLLECLALSLSLSLCLSLSLSTTVPISPYILSFSRYFVESCSINTTSARRLRRTSPLRFIYRHICVCMSVCMSVYVCRDDDSHQCVCVSVCVFCVYFV